MYSHPDICRNYALRDCNILDIVGKVNSFFLSLSFFLSFFFLSFFLTFFLSFPFFLPFFLFSCQSSLYVLKEKIFLVQKFLLMQSSFVSLAPLTNALLIEQLLYYAEPAVKHIII